MLYFMEEKTVFLGWFVKEDWNREDGYLNKKQHSKRCVELKIRLANKNPTKLNLLRISCTKILHIVVSQSAAKMHIATTLSL